MNTKETLLRCLVLLSIFASASLAAQIPSPALLVVLKDEATLAIIDPASGKLVGQAPTGQGPHEVAVSDDGKLAFVTNYGQGVPGSSLSVIDLTTLKELRRVEIAPSSAPHGILFAGGKVYFTAQGSKLIGSYDAATDKIDWLMGIGQDRTHMLVMTKDMSRIFTSNIGSESVSAVERSGDPPDWKVTHITVGKLPEAIDMSPDEKEVWVATYGDGAVTIIDATNKKVIQTLDLKLKRSNRIKFTPDGKLVFISDNGVGELVVIDAASRKEIKRMKLGANFTGILMAPDGSRAFAAISRDSNIAVIDLKTLELTSRIPTGKSPDGMVWAVRR
jgi:DNA-binding beta-propeller fold protein YncE